MIDALLDQARATPRDMPEGLAARMLRDAYDEQAARRDAVPVTAPARQAVRGWRPGLWRQFLDAVGGYPSVAGLASVAVFGVFIGINTPDLLTQGATTLGLTTASTDLYMVDVASVWDDLAAEQ
ncbi:hypothetical protein ATO6_21550 [Oceanicola sp. 22II-s10i]|nr:hypothetical protein ATO6_21550 [Oceanicola sp. 22II-s10i]